MYYYLPNKILYQIPVFVWGWDLLCIIQIPNVSLFSYWKTLLCRLGRRLSGFSSRGELTIIFDMTCNVVDVKYWQVKNPTTICLQSFLTSADNVMNTVQRFVLVQDYPVWKNKTLPSTCSYEQTRWAKTQSSNHDISADSLLADALSCLAIRPFGHEKSIYYLTDPVKRLSSTSPTCLPSTE